MIALRHLAEINPPSPEFDGLPSDTEVLFLPLETVWSDGRADQTRRAPKSALTAGYTRFQAGDTVCPKVTPTFQAGRSMRAESVGAGTTELHVLRPRPGVDPRWVTYAVRSKPFLEEGVAAFQGVAGLQRVPHEFVANFQIADASPQEQRRIADFLDDRVARIDRTIAARRQQAQRSDELFMEQVRVLTTQGSVVETRASGVPWMPTVGVGFVLWRMGQAFTTGSGTTPRSDRPEYYDGDIPWATTSDLRDRYEVVPPRRVTTLAIADHSALPIYPAGTLLVAMYGATVGRAGILGVDATVNQACCALISRGVVRPEYAFHWFVAHRPEIMTLASGGGQPNISQDVVRGLRIPAPPWAQQQEIIEALGQLAEDADAARSTIERSTALLTELKGSLITAAVTGELDVTTAGSGIPG